MIWFWFVKILKNVNKSNPWKKSNWKNGPWWWSETLPPMMIAPSSHQSTMKISPFLNKMNNTHYLLHHLHRHRRLHLHHHHHRTHFRHLHRCHPRRPIPLPRTHNQLRRRPIPGWNEPARWRGGLGLGSRSYVVRFLRWFPPSEIMMPPKGHSGHLAPSRRRRRCFGCYSCRLGGGGVEWRVRVVWCRPLRRKMRLVFNWLCSVCCNARVNFVVIKVFSCSWKFQRERIGGITNCSEN